MRLSGNRYRFLGGAQIASCGNLNSTVISDYHHPKVCLPGKGGPVGLKGEPPVQPAAESG